MALRADHGGGPEPRPGPCGPARGQAAEDARLARSGSARTSRISVDTAHWFAAGIAGALLVNPGRGTGLPRCSPPSRAGGPLDAEDPAGITTTLRDAPAAPTTRRALGRHHRAPARHRADPAPAHAPLVLPRTPSRTPRRTRPVTPGPGPHRATRAPAPATAPRISRAVSHEAPSPRGSAKSVAGCLMFGVFGVLTGVRRDPHGNDEGV